MKKKQNKSGMEPIEPLDIHSFDLFNNDDLANVIFIIEEKQREIIDRVNMLLDNRK